MNRAVRVMVVEDEAIVAFNLQQRLTRLGYDVPAMAASCDEALGLADSQTPDLVLMDIRIQGEVDGIETATRLNRDRPTPVIYLTSHSEDSVLERARATSPYGYLIKPFSERELHATIQMALARRDAEIACAVSEERLRLAMDAAGLGVWDMDADTREVSLRGNAALILGVGAEHLSWDEMLQHVDAGDRARVSDALEADFRLVGRAAIEFRVAREAGEAGWARLLARLVAADHSSDQRVIGVLQDVTEQRAAHGRIEQLNRELESRVEARTRELEVTLGELDAFNYSVAHDLRAPVRAINSFTAILLDEHGAAMPAEARATLERVARASRRMGELIEALLSLARITRQPLSRSDVDLSSMATEILATLRDEAPLRVVDIRIQTGMTASGDPGLIRVVLENLLRNAWKFTSGQPRACIEAGCRRIDGENEYFVSDNGVGFDSIGQSQLFRLFHRLHSASEFDGLGIGLVTVQRIVHRHGGQVRAEGQVGKGATFAFSLA